MWTFKQTLLNSDHIYQFSLFQNHQQVTFAQVIFLWQQDRTFRNFWLEFLEKIQMKAYFWETPPITKSSCNRSFEFVIIDSPRLAVVKPDFDSFKQHFQAATHEVVDFMNLSKDALLVAPCPITNESDYPHLASFVRNAPPSQQHLLWQTVGYKIQQCLEKFANAEKPVWVSTSGLGVYWLHIRLDSIPKYYRFEPYRSQQVDLNTNFSD